MDPHVYPDLQAPPLNLAAGGTAVFASFEQLAAPDASTPAIAKTMFIRVAMSGPDCPGLGSGCAPAILIKADSGDPVTLSAFTQPIFRTPGIHLPDYVADGVVAAEANNIYLVTITFSDDAGNYSWQLGIRNNDAAARDFTWVVSATLVNTAQPWVDVSPGSLRYRLLGTNPVTQNVQIANKGTAPFTVTGVNPALPSGFSLGALPGAAVRPTGSVSLAVTFTPSPAALNNPVSANVEVAISPADRTSGSAAGHNGRIALEAVAPQFQIGVASTVGVDTLIGPAA